MSQDPFLKHQDLERAQQILAGDRQAFEGFFDEYFDPLYRFALSRLGDDSLAKDMVQSTFCRAIEKLDTYRGEAALLSWMFSICRFEISAHHRHRQRQATVETPAASDELWAILDTLADEQPSVEEAAMRRQLKSLVHLTLDHLPKHYGEALEWKYLEGLPVSEIASRLGLGSKAAESVLTRARQAFKRAFNHLDQEIARPPGGSLQHMVPTGSPR